MRVYITTTATNHITEIDAGPGDAAHQVWKQIERAIPLQAGIAQPSGEAGETRWTLFNLQHVVKVHEIPEQ